MRPTRGGLGAQLDQLAGLSNDELIQKKAEAYALGYERFSMRAVKPVWEMVLTD
jgi:hypothetical protein